MTILLIKSKSKTIVWKYKISKEQVYRITSETKKSLLKHSQRQNRNDSKKRVINKDLAILAILPKF